MTKSTYAEKLRDPRWQKKRLEIFERDKWKCQSCGDEESMLVIHHRLYHSRREPWEYDESELVTLCDICHSAETQGFDEELSALGKELRKKFLSFDVHLLSEVIRLMNRTQTVEFIGFLLSFPRNGDTKKWPV